MGLGEPMGMVFGPDGIIVANSYDQPGDILQVDASGKVEIYLNDNLAREGFSPSDVEYATGGGFGTGLYFTDFFAWSVYKGGTEAQHRNPWVRFPSLEQSDYPRSLAFDPGGEFGGALYVAVHNVIYQVRPGGDYVFFAKGFGHIHTDGLKFSRTGNALYVIDNEGSAIYKIIRATDQEASEMVTIKGKVIDQTGEPVDRIRLSFFGAQQVETDNEGNYELTYPKSLGDEPVSIDVVVADSLTPERYQSSLQSVSVEDDENVVDLVVNQVPATVFVGGRIYEYLDSTIRKYLNDDEDYHVGEYHGGEMVSYNYYGLGAVRHEYYFRNPGVQSATMNLSYRNRSYAPVRIYKRGNAGGEEETVGHLFIDQEGNVVKGDNAGSIIMALHIGMHTFGELTSYRLDEQLKFYKNLKALVVDMGRN